MAAAAAAGATGAGFNWGQFAGAAAGSGGMASIEPIIGGAMAGLQHSWAKQASSDAQNYAQYMANTVYRRAVRDLQLAGLNPMLAYTQGGNPAPVVGQTDVPHIRGDFDSDAVGKAISTGKAAMQVKSDMELLRNAVRSSEEGVKQAVNETERSRLGILTEMGRANAAAEEPNVLRSHRALMDAEAGRAGADQSLIRARDRAERLRTPYSPEQEEVVRKAYRGFVEPYSKLFEGASSAAKQGIELFRDALRRKQEREGYR